MKFKDFYEGQVLAHISGASGSGKTYLANELSKVYPSVIFKDLDEFDDEAVDILKYNNIRKSQYTDDMLLKLANLRQKLMDEFVAHHNKPIIFVGHHTEGEHVLNISTKNKFLLNVDAKTSAWQAYLRSQKEDIKHRRTLEELPEDEKEAQEVINYLLKNGYKKLDSKEIKDWMKNNL